MRERSFSGLGLTLSVLTLSMGIAEEAEEDHESLESPEPSQAGAATAAIHPSMLGDTSGLFKAWENFLASLLPSLTGHYQVAHVDFHGTLTSEARPKPTCPFLASFAGLCVFTAEMIASCLEATEGSGMNDVHHSITYSSQ